MEWQRGQMIYWKTKNYHFNDYFGYWKITLNALQNLNLGFGKKQYLSNQYLNHDSIFYDFNPNFWNLGLTNLHLYYFMKNLICLKNLTFSNFVHQKTQSFPYSELYYYHFVSLNVKNYYSSLCQTIIIHQICYLVIKIPKKLIIL